MTGSGRYIRLQRLMDSLLRPGRANWRLGLFGILRRAIALLRERLPGVPT
jgi:hypothetical protein